MNPLPSRKRLGTPHPAGAEPRNLSCYHVRLLELDATNATDYLRSRGMDYAATRISELGGGVSNTVLLVETAGRRFLLKQSLGKLSVKADWFSDRQRIFRESAALSWAAQYLPPGSVPEILFEDPGVPRIS